MKANLPESWLLGKFPSPVFRRPVRPLPPDQIEGLRLGLQKIGLKPVATEIRSVEFAPTAPWPNPAAATASG